MSKPLLDRKETDQLNLAVLRRVDPGTIIAQRIHAPKSTAASCTMFVTSQVLAAAGHVGLYSFDTDKKAWVNSASLSPPAYTCWINQHQSIVLLQSRKDVEGSLFVEKAKSASLQNSHPQRKESRLAVFGCGSIAHPCKPGNSQICPGLLADDFVEDILTDFKFEVASPYGIEAKPMRYRNLAWASNVGVKHSLLVHFHI